jgi:hypothetical protein
MFRRILVVIGFLLVLVPFLLILLLVPAGASMRRAATCVGSPASRPVSDAGASGAVKLTMLSLCSVWVAALAATARAPRVRC